MSMKRSGLGRGLDALLGSGTSPGPSDSAMVVREVPVEMLRRGIYQPRDDIREDTLQELADSIQSQGMVQPIIARPLADGGYEIVAGERRWRAAQLVGLDRVPVLIRDIEDRAAIAMALIENIQREDLNPLEEAHALSRLVEEFQLTHQEVAAAVGRSRAAVSNLLRLLDLSDSAQTLLRERKLEMGHARALLPLDPARQDQAARHVVARALSVRETEAFVRRLLSEPKSAPHQTRVDPDIRRLQNDLSERLGARVKLEHQVSGRGRVVIHYNTVDELDGILAHVK